MSNSVSVLALLWEREAFSPGQRGSADPPVKGVQGLTHTRNLLWAALEGTCNGWSPAFLCSEAHVRPRVLARRPPRHSTQHEKTRGSARGREDTRPALPPL